MLMPIKSDRLIIHEHIYTVLLYWVWVFKTVNEQIY